MANLDIATSHTNSCTNMLVEHRWVQCQLLRFAQTPDVASLLGMGSLVSPAKNVFLKRLCMGRRWVEWRLVEFQCASCAARSQHITASLEKSAGRDVLGP